MKALDTQGFTENVPIEHTLYHVYLYYGVACSCGGAPASEACASRELVSGTSPWDAGGCRGIRIRRWGKTLRSTSLYTPVLQSLELQATSATGSPEQPRCNRFALPEFVEFADPDTKLFVNGLRGTTCDVRFVLRRSLPSWCEPDDAPRLRLRDATAHQLARHAVHFSQDAPGTASRPNGRGGVSGSSGVCGSCCNSDQWWWLWRWLKKQRCLALASFHGSGATT